MRSMLNLYCLVGLLVSLAWAAPHNKIQKRSFKVERVRNLNFRGYDGPNELLKVHLKYNLRPPQALMDRLTALDAARKNATRSAATAATAAGVSKKKGKNKGGAAANANSSTGTGSVSAAANATAETGVVENTPTSGDVEYLSPVTIGGQTLNLDFDTGSSDLWVFNTQLSARQSNGQTLYDPNQSANFQLLSGQKFAVSYGDGSQVAGNVGTDTVVIGGATATKQAVEMATAVSSSFVQDSLSDGLLGLAFSKLNTVQPTQQKTFFDNIQASLAEPLFAADLRHNASGSYQFGAIDTTKFSGSLNSVPINTTQGFWQVSSSSFAVGSGQQQSSGSPGQAIADTGTTLMLVNDVIANAYFANVTGAKNNAQVGGITVPCDATLPDLQIDMGGVMATVKGSDMIFTQVSGNTCFSGLQATTSDFMIFGDIFFKSNYVVFNGGNNTLAFAPHA